MKNYLNIDKNNEFSGAQILKNSSGNFLRVIINGEKKLIKKTKIEINEFKMYRLVYFPDMIKIYPVNNGWACSQTQYEEIKKQGQEVLNRIFNEIIGK